MHRFVGVLLEFDTAVNPEPGVARAPTASEQAMALEAQASGSNEGTNDATDLAALELGDALL